MSAMVFEITGVSILYLTVSSGADKRKHQSPAMTGKFPAQKASNAENVSIWWPDLVKVDAIINGHNQWIFVKY